MHALKQTNQQQTPKTPYIALIGFAEYCPVTNALMAIEVGRQVAQRELGLVVGNTKGTFHHALSAANSIGGKTYAALEPTHRSWIAYALDYVERCQTQDSKHELISQKADAGIIIGGGHRSQLLVNKFLSRGKPVAALEGTGGITDTLKREQVPQYQSVSSALDFLLERLKESKNLRAV